MGLLRLAGLEMTIKEVALASQSSLDNISNLPLGISDRLRLGDTFSLPTSFGVLNFDFLFVLHMHVEWSAPSLGVDILHGIPLCTRLTQRANRMLTGESTLKSSHSIMM